MLEITFQVVPPSVEYSQFRILPVCPESVSTPPFAPEQTVALALTVPPRETGSTVIVTSEEVAEGQVPLCTTAWYMVVMMRLLYACELVIFAIGVQVTPPSIDCSQFVTAPVFPDKTNVPAFEPEQTVALDAIVPPTVTGSTVMVAGFEFCVVHPGL